MTFSFVCKRVENHVVSQAQQVGVIFRRWGALHSTLYTLHFRLDLLHSALYTAHFTLYTSHSTLYTPRFAVDTWHFTLYTWHSTLHILNTLYKTFTLHSRHFPLQALHLALHSAHVTLYVSHVHSGSWRLDFGAVLFIWFLSCYRPANPGLKKINPDQSWSILFQDVTLTRFLYPLLFP